MIELNLTYEESKRILELGYDFSSICRDFELYEEGKITKFVLVERHACGLVDLWDSDDQEVRGYSPKSWWITPIIPKAALEECLPRNIGRYPCASHLVRRVEEFAYRRNGKEFPYINFNSAYEAFLWCHENYPEKLKKRFDEVMGND